MTFVRKVNTCKLKFNLQLANICVLFFEKWGTDDHCQTELELRYIICSIFEISTFENVSTRVKAVSGWNIPLRVDGELIIASRLEIDIREISTRSSMQSNP